jgi:multicomponent Na+:H+ antiporter subunit B
VSTRARTLLFAAGAAGLAALLGWGVAGLPAFGDYSHAYGLVLVHVEPTERHAANVVASVVFDYRGFDTLGEELILFAAVMGTALLLRERREQETRGVRDRIESDAVRAVGLLAVPAVVLLAIDVVSHGYLTPGGGFQGGVVAAAGLLLVYLAGEWRAMRRAAPVPLVDGAEAVGAGGFVVVGLAMLIAGGAFLENLVPLGKMGVLTSAGEIPIVNWCAGLEVSAAFVLLFMEFLEEVMGTRKQDGDA